MSQYKVGDQVRLRISVFEPQSPGDIGTVEMVASDYGATLKFGDSDALFFYYNTEIEPVLDNPTFNVRRFILVRNEDASGVSGTGEVAEGVMFHDGTCAMSWLTQFSSIGIYPSSDELIKIHGHGGRTQLKFIDK